MTDLLCAISCSAPRDGDSSRVCVDQFCLFERDPWKNPTTVLAATRVAQWSTNSVQLNAVRRVCSFPVEYNTETCDFCREVNLVVSQCLGLILSTCCLFTQPEKLCSPRRAFNRFDAIELSHGDSNVLELPISGIKSVSLLSHWKRLGSVRTSAPPQFDQSQPPALARSGIDR